METKRVTEALIRNVPEPQFTDTWHPVAHAKVLDALEGAVKKPGLEVVDRKYSVSQNLQDYFGTWQLQHYSKGSHWMIGHRNSLQKNFALGICAGTHVIACANMVFSGEFIEFRRHTGRLDYDELQFLAERGVGSLVGKMEKYSEWHQGLKEHTLRKKAFKALTYDAMVGEAFPPSQFSRFLECIEEEKKVDPEPGLSLFNFHGACTRLMRDASLFAISERSTNLELVVNNFIKFN